MLIKLILMSLIITASYAADGKKLFDTLCMTCHGPTGAGDGPVGKALPPAQRPANMQTGVFKFTKDEAKFAELLKKGGAGVGLLPLMPAQAQLKPDEVTALYKYVISLKK